MWRQLIDFGRRHFSLQRTVDRHSEEIKAGREENKETRQELRALAELVREIRTKQELDHAVAEKDRDNLVLRLENALLRIERGLPPARPDDQDPDANS